jgi:hypothetical protein
MKAMKNEQKCLLFFLVLGIITTTFGSALAAQPTLGEVTVNPEHPIRFSKVTFTIKVIGEGISSVKIAVLECNASAGICEKNRDNITMQLVDGNLYRANVTLNYATASYMSYWIYVQDITGTTTLPNAQGVKVTLSASSTNGTNGNNDNGGGKSPGFEMVLFIAAVYGMMILLGRKRFQ